MLNKREFFFNSKLVIVLAERRSDMHDAGSVFLGDEIAGVNPPTPFCVQQGSTGKV